jgi:esterase/lipase superfamily enzyme
MTGSWDSPRVEARINLVRWGHWGTPVLVFPTAGGDAEEIERFHVVQALWPLIEAGRIKVYSCDSLAGQVLICGQHSPQYCATFQNRFDACVYHEIIPAIRADCAGIDLSVITAGASIGAYNALATLCRHPDAVSAAVGLSGTYDLSRFLGGSLPQEFYFASPLHYLPALADCAQLETLRTRFAIMAFGQGRWEDPDESWRLAGVLGDKGVPNRVDAWGPEYDHDWPTWREMLPKYLDELT